MEEKAWLMTSAASVSRSWPPTASSGLNSSSRAVPCTARAPTPSCCRSILARSRPGSSTWYRRARSRSTSSSPTPPRRTTTPCCCREAPSTPTSCGSTQTRWRSSGPSPRQASPSRRSATARGRLSLRASSTAAGSPRGPACAMTCAMPARSRSTSKSSSTARSPPAAPRRTCPPSARRSSSSSPAAGYRASRRLATVAATLSSALPKEILVKAVVYHGPRNVSVDEVPDAKIEKPTDALVRITATKICGSDLHMYEGRTDFEEGRVFGHENVGEVIGVGDAVDKIKVGDMISAPFNVACGHCRHCEEGLTNYCLRANKPGIAGAAYGFADMGPWQGGQAELLRVPWGDFNCLRLPEDASEKQDDYVMLSDIFPTGWHAVRMSGLHPGES